MRKNNQTFGTLHYLKSKTKRSLYYLFLSLQESDDVLGGFTEDEIVNKSVVSFSLLVKKFKKKYPELSPDKLLEKIDDWLTKV